MVTQKELLQALGGERSGAGIVCAGPNHSKHDRSLSVTPANNKNGFVVHSFAGDDDLECLDFVRAKLGLGEWTPTERTRTKPLTTPNPKPVKRAERVCDYIYHTADGQPYLRVTRMSDKSFRQSHYDDIDGWVSGKPKGSPVPYNLPAIIKRSEDIIYLVEGEKDADTLTSLGFLATTASGGGKSFPTDIEFLRWFDGREVVAIPDNDDVGSAWADRVRDGIADVAFVRVPIGKDVTDYVESGATADDIRALSEYVHESETETPAPPRFSIKPFDFDFLDTITPREWLLDDHYIRDYVSLTVSPGGLGKSSMAMIEGLSMASNRPLFDGMKLHEQRKLRVMYWNGEDPQEENGRRLKAAMIHYGIKPDDIRGFWFMESGREKSIRLASMVRGETLIDEEFFVELESELKAAEIDVFIIDPFVQVHGVSENDNGAIDAIAKRLGKLAGRCRLSLELVHHVRKPSTTHKAETDVNDARGASALQGAVRAARVLNVMSEDVAELAGVDESERERYFSTKVGKASMSPSKGQSAWRHMVGVPIGNATDTREQDYVGVCTYYELPERARVTERWDQVRETVLQTLVGRQDLRHWQFGRGPAPKMWLGYEVALNADLNAADKLIRKKLCDLIEYMIKDDEIHTVDSTDERGHHIKYVVYGGAPDREYTPPPHDDQPF